MTEIELKLLLDPGDHGRVRRAPALSGARPRRRRLESTYFDTPGGELAERGMVLRLRRCGGRWIQGLKADARAAGGLHRRDEWEFARADAGIDLARFAATPLAGIEDAATLHERLAPIFRVDVTRTTWIVAPAPGTRLEVALDAGAVESRGRRETVSELEIECLEGDAPAAFELAARLLESVPLRPSPVTKAERGYRLYRAVRPAPVKARALELDPALAPLEAARCVVAAGLEQLQANEEGLLGSADPEFVHQARIALRRMRAALRMFRDAIGAERAGEFRAALGDVARALGSARDWDVFATETFPAVAKAFGEPRTTRPLAARLARRRRAEREAAREVLRSTAYARAILGIARWLAEPAAAAQPADADLASFAARVLRKRHRRLLRDAERLATLTPPERHRLRIDAKRLRYGTDALASLFGARRVGDYVDALAALQDALGEANDAATAVALLEELRPPPAFAAFARGWFAARARGDDAYLEALVARLACTRRFWRR